jgi:hypothetical protein
MAEQRKQTARHYRLVNNLFRILTYLIRQPH